MLAWDSTHLQLLAYVPLGTAGIGPTVATWDGSWHVRSGAGTAPGGAGVLIDEPALHGVLLVTRTRGASYASGSSDTWLWDGSRFSALRPGSFDQCLSPSSGAWDPVHSQVVMVMSSQCSNGGAPLPSETFVFDGTAWHDAGPLPGGVIWPALAWDAGSNRTVMVQGLTPSAPAQSAHAWSWNGRGWLKEGAMTGPQPEQFAGAAFDATAGGVVALPTPAGPPFAWVVKDGLWSQLGSANAVQHVIAVAADGAQHRIIVLGEAPAVPGATPGSSVSRDYLLTWDGHRWVAL